MANAKGILGLRCFMVLRFQQSGSFLCDKSRNRSDITESAERLRNMENEDYLYRSMLKAIDIVSHRKEVVG